MQRSADLVGKLGQHLVVPATRNPVEFGADVEQGQVGAGQRTQRVVLFSHGQAVGEVSDGQGVEQLNIAQAAAARFDIGLGAVGDLTAATPPGVGLVDDFAEDGLDSGPPLAADSLDEATGQLFVAGDVPGIQHRQAGGHVCAGDLQCLSDGPNTVIKANIGVPQRIPQRIGDIPDGVGVHAVVQQQQVQVRVRRQLATAQRTGRHDREATAGHDADLGSLCGQPEFVQFAPRFAQGGRVEFIRSAG